MNIPRKTMVIAAGVALAFLTGVANGAITDSAHDFSGDTWNSTGEICVVCHTPHNALTGTDAPLWNHETTAATFTVYTSGTLDATTGQPSGASIMCLSCHDGTVAPESFGGNNAGSTNYIGGSKNLGTDLSNDHPISFTYDDSLAGTDGELAVPSAANSGLGGTIEADMLISNQMQCSSCHDVHNGAGNSDLLVVSNAASALCLTCHTK